MPSRIDIGPEGGPFVAINKANNDLELQDINGNVIAKWDETAGQWDFNSNDLANVGGIDATELTSSLDGGGNSLTNMGAVETDKTQSTINNGQYQTGIEGLVVPAADGVGVGDAVPVSNNNPVNDAINIVANAGGGTVYLPPGSVTQNNPVTCKDDVSIQGQNRKTANVVKIDSSANRLFETDGNDVRRATYSNFEVRGQGATSHQADCVHPNGGIWIDSQWRDVGFGDVQGRGVFEPGFQLSFENCYFNPDAGAENAMFEWDGVNHPAINFHNPTIYPDDAASAADSTLFTDSQNTIGSSSIAITGAVNIGGAAGKIILAEYNRYLICGVINWEPGTQNSTPSELFEINVDRNFNILSADVQVDGTVGDVYHLNYNPGDAWLSKPRISGTLNGDVVRISGGSQNQADTIVYGGQSSDVNNDTGGTLSPGIACLGDLTLVT